MTSELTQALIMALVVGVASGSIGAFIILRRMALVGDALSHVALPGIGLALLYHFDPFWAVVISLLLAGYLIWWLENHSKLPTDALVGLLFTGSLAIGILTIPDTEILESLFGEFPQLSPLFLIGFVIVGVVATMLIFRLARRWLFLIVAPDLAQVRGVSRRYDLVLLLVFGFVVALGIKLVGTLLMGALTVIPASIAKNIAKSMTEHILLSAFFGGLISVIGVLLANYWQIVPGPTIILFGLTLFLVSLFLVRK